MRKTVARTLAAAALIALAATAATGEPEVVSGTIDEVIWVSVQDSETYRVFRLRNGRRFIASPAIADPLIEGMHIEVEVAKDRSAIKVPAIDFKYRHASVVQAVRVDYVEIESGGG